MTRADSLCARLAEDRAELEKAIHDLVVNGSYSARRAALKGEIVVAKTKELELAIGELSMAIESHQIS